MDLHDDSSSDRYVNTEGSEGEVQPFIDTMVPLHTQNANTRFINSDQKLNNVTPHHAHTLSDGPSIRTSSNKQMATTFVDKTQKHVSSDEELHSSANLQQIPLYVWKNKHLSKHHVACIAQNGGDFGYPFERLESL